VVRSDAIKQFAGTLIQARPVWRTDFIHNLADRIIDPTPPDELPTLTPPLGSQSASRAPQAVEQGFNPNELGFAFEESEGQPETQSSDAAVSPRPQGQARPAPAKKKFLGLQDTQIILLAGMFLVEVCILFGFGIILYLNL
jgi:hypothetical protein